MQSFINQNTYLPLAHTFTSRPPDIAQALALLEGEQGDDGVDEFLALDKFGRFHAVAKDLVERIGQHRLAEGGHIRGIGRFASRSRDAPPRLGYRRLINHTAPDPASRLFPKRPPAFLPGPSKYIEWQTWRWAAPVCSRMDVQHTRARFLFTHIFFFSCHRITFMRK